MRRPSAAERRAKLLAKAIAAREGLAVEVVWHDVWNARRGRAERKRAVTVVDEDGFVTGFSSGARGYLSWGSLVRDYMGREGISSEEELELRFATEGMEMEEA